MTGVVPLVRGVTASSSSSSEASTSTEASTTSSTPSSASAALETGDIGSLGADLELSLSELGVVEGDCLGHILGLSKLDVRVALGVAGELVHENGRNSRASKRKKKVG